MNDLNELFKEIPIADIAKQLGEPESDVRAAVATALPTLVGGMRENAKDPAAAASLAQAIAKKDPGLVEGGISVGDVDAEDGLKIASHIFGGNTDDVMSALGSTNSGGSDLTKKVIAIIAPIVLSWLAKKMLGGGGNDSGGGMLGDVISGALSGGSSSGGISDILGDVLGGALSGGGTSKSGGDDVLGDVLGSVLGGSGGGSSSGGLGDLIGGLLGGGSR